MPLNKINRKSLFVLSFLACLFLLIFSAAQVYPTEQTISVVYKDGKLSVKAENATLKDVLEIIAQKADLDLILKSSPQISVTTNFEAMDIEEGIKRLIRGLNSVFCYSRLTPDATNLKLTSVLILSNSDARESAVFRSSPNHENSGQASAPVAGRNPSEEIDSLSEAALKEDRALYALLEIAKYEDDKEKRLAAVQALGDLGNPEAKATLLSAARNDNDAAVRAAAVEALGNVAGKDSMEFLTQALKDENTEVRTAAVESLASVGGEDATNVLIQAMKDEEAEVRSTAINALAEIGDRKAAQALTAALSDDNQEVQESAKEALDQMGIEKGASQK